MKHKEMHNVEYYNTQNTPSAHVGYKGLTK